MGFLEDKAAIEQILGSHGWGTVAMVDNDQPYQAPVNYAYVHGAIVFHCAFTGRKMDCMKANPRVCFCAAHQAGTVQEHPGGKPCHVDSESVLVFGQARLVEEIERKLLLANAFNRVFRPEAKDLTEQRLVKCAIVEIVIDEMSARIEKGGKTIFVRHAGGQ